MKISLRNGTLADARALFDVFAATTADIERRMGTPENVIRWSDPASLDTIWAERQPLLQHLTRTSDEFWVAESEDAIVGFARSTIHDGVRELIEYFVLPEWQGQGVGRELLHRAFASDGARFRAVIATTDMRALARYLKAGVYPRFAVYYLSRKPESVAVETDLIARPVTAGLATLALLREIDRVILGFARDADHEFLLGDRQGFLYYRGDQIAGYGYFGNGTGPIALLDDSDYPAVLAHAESLAAAASDSEFGMNVPMHNRAAVDYLLGRSYRIEPFTVFFMTDKPFGKFENYIISSPAMFL